MRKKPPSQEHSREASSLSRIVEAISELQERVEQLENEVFPCGPSILSPLRTKPRMGRKPKLETEKLLKRRVHLTAWLEQNWPRLSVAMRRAENSGDPAAAIAALVAAKAEGISGVAQPRFYDSPEKYEQELGKFLRSGRFHGNPRNLAAAMAGLPELSWKRSFDICTKHPYKGGQMLQAYWDHMRRNFPDRLRELEEARTPLDVKIILARSRTDDPFYLHLKENPDKVKEWLEAGKPKG
jgi:hypothetical protein